MSQIGIIIEREFNERVRKKSFIITTLLMPLLVVALMVAPSLVMVMVPDRSVRQTSTPASRSRLRAASWGWP